MTLIVATNVRNIVLKDIFSNHSSVTANTIKICYAQMSLKTYVLKVAVLIDLINHNCNVLNDNETSTINRIPFHYGCNKMQILLLRT